MSLLEYSVVNFGGKPEEPDFMAQIYQINKEAFGSGGRWTSSFEMFCDDRAKLGKFAAVMADSRVIGGAFLELGQPAELNLLVTTKEYRSTGPGTGHKIGSSLVSAVCSSAYSHRARRINVCPSEPSIPFYKSLGFEIYDWDKPMMMRKYLEADD